MQNWEASVNKTALVLIWLPALCVLAVPASAQNQRLPDIVYMDQPNGIEYSVYASTWPSLSPYIDRLKASQSAAVEANLQRRAAAADVSDGELNLLAQLEWQRGALDEADVAVARAVALRPSQSLNAFQQAMVTFAHLRRASGALEQWKWQQRTRDAYQRTFDLDPHNLSARYYLAYTYMNTPWIGGGDKKKALQLSEGGIALGQNGFYVVRADAHRLLGDLDAANADYDRAIVLKVFKLSGFLDAANEEMSRNQWDRAKRYLDWAVHCRPDATKAHEDLGDYYLARNDRQHARQSYQTAVDRDPNNESARKKLAQLAGSG
jgi:cytochrome c-type biogenesis protein CcmH/NrfG